MYVVTGATGQLGRLVVEGLLAAVPASEVAVAVRSAGKAADLAARGVAVRVVDYDDPASLAGAFAAGDRVLLISGSEVGRRIPQHRAVVDAARAAGVALFAYTSAPGAATFRLADEHKATEELIRASGLPSVLLRNGWYTENYLGDAAARWRAAWCSAAPGTAGWPPPRARTTRTRRSPCSSARATRAGCTS